MTTEDLLSVGRLNTEFVMVSESVWLLVGMWYGVAMAVEVLQVGESEERGRPEGDRKEIDIVERIQKQFERRIAIVQQNPSSQIIQMIDGKNRTIRNFENQLGEGRRMSPNAATRQHLGAHLGGHGDVSCSVETPE